MTPGLMIPTPAPDLLRDLLKAGAAKYWRPMVLKLSGLEGISQGINYGLAGGDPAKEIEIGDQAFVSDKTAAHLAVVQGLVKAGVLKPDPSFYRNGHVVADAGLPILLNQPQATTYAGYSLQQWVQQAVNGMELQQ